MAVYDIRIDRRVLHIEGDIHERFTAIVRFTNDFYCAGDGETELEAMEAMIRYWKDHEESTKRSGEQKQNKT